MEIGRGLKEERLKRGLTLEDVSKETLIRAYYLEKIENDDFGENFDGFILSYIKKYAEFLGIEPKPFVDAYKTLLEEREVLPRSEKNNKRLIFIIVILLITVGIILGIIQSGIFRNPSKETTQNSSTNTQNILTPSQTLPPETQPTTPQTPVETKPQYPVNLILKSTGRCWLGITIDGRSSQRFINKDETLELNANNYIQILYGNAKVVEVTFNGKPLGLVSKDTVVEYRYTEKGVEKVESP